MPVTKQEKIANALAAGPAAITKDAAVLEWPVNEGEAPPVLREGSSSWTCFVDDPSWPGNDAMCIDPEWQTWYRAYMAKETPPRPKQVGIGYMLTIDTYVSNTDPYAMEATPDNQWHKVAPHIMVLVPDPAMLDSFPTDPAAVGPYVMYKGTPFAHLMVPVK